MFKINQKVVCVQTHSMGAVIKDKTYIVSGNNFCCSPLVDVGIKQGYDTGRMPCCEKYMRVSGVWWIDADLFRPLQEEKGTTFIEDFIEIKETNKITFL